jgi:hypothetical protein
MVTRSRPRARRCGRPRLVRDGRGRVAAPTASGGSPRRAGRLIVVTPDPVVASAAAMRRTAVRLTMIDGRIAWRA